MPSFGAIGSPESICPDFESLLLLTVEKAFPLVIDSSICREFLFSLGLLALCTCRTLPRNLSLHNHETRKQLGFVTKTKIESEQINYSILMEDE